MTCPICFASAARILQATPATHGAVTCPRCGEFNFAPEAAAAWKGSDPSGRQIANAGGWLRERQGFRIRAQDVDALLAARAPEVAERADAVLREMSRRAGDVFGAVNINFCHRPESADPAAYDADTLDWLGVSWSMTPAELRFLVVKYLQEHKRFLAIEFRQPSGQRAGDYYAAITPLGHEHLAALKRVNEESDIGFCAMWFSEEVRPVWLEAIEPAILAAGYRPVRIDRVEHNNKIDDEIIAAIRRSRFLVSDLTGHRGGVYFEAGFAMGLGLPVVWTCSEEDLASVHFDNRQYNFVLWRPAEIADFRARLTNRIEATLGRGRYRPA
jgi:hypothetical protein